VAGTQCPLQPPEATKKQVFRDFLGDMFLFWFLFLEVGF
jgi:hypothetical protein